LDDAGMRQGDEQHSPEHLAERRFIGAKRHVDGDEFAL
jgi:hypothetical protein